MKEGRPAVVSRRRACDAWRVSRPAPGLEALIGNTPLVELKSVDFNPRVRLFAKLEGLNPTGSIKDRIVAGILREARRTGELQPGQPVVEASTGNTGVALAAFGRLLGHPVGVCVPDSVYPQIEQLLDLYGAMVDRVPRQAGIKSAVEVARRIAGENGAYLLNQFGSPVNARIHYETTGAEILRDLEQVDVVVAGIGTGGTITGVGRRLKEANPSCRVVGVEPRLGVHVQGLHSLEDGFIPPVLDETVLDSKIIVGSRHAFAHAREVMLHEGIFGGISSGAVLHAAVREVQKLSRGNIVMIFADGGWKYVGTELWHSDHHGQDVDHREDPLDDVLWW